MCINAFVLSICNSFCVCLCYAGLMYDLTASYTVGFIILGCVALTALSLIISVYIIDRRMKKSTSSTQQSADNTKY